MSEHSVNIIEIGEVRGHDNADLLEIVPVGSWQAVVKKGTFKVGDRAVYVEPDYMVPTSRPEFAFLAKVGANGEIDGKAFHRLKAIRLRGALSFGLLIPVPQDLADRTVGADVMVDLGIQRYEPTIKLAQADELPAADWPTVYASKFDVESLERHKSVLEPSERVLITEKIHGANARFLSLGGVFFIGSRGRWLRPDMDHPWGRAAKADSVIQAWCEAHPGVVLYGEIYGAVQSLKYGLAAGEIAFAAFAASEGGEWWDTPRLFSDDSLRTVPLLYDGPWSPDLPSRFAEADSSIRSAPAGHMREGVVIVPATERRDERLGRVALKHISNRYWESAA